MHDYNIIINHYDSLSDNLIHPSTYLLFTLLFVVFSFVTWSINKYVESTSHSQEEVSTIKKKIHDDKEAMAELNEEAVNIKEKLSSADECEFRIKKFLGGADFVFVIKQTEYNQIVQPVLERANKTLTEAKQDFKSKCPGKYGFTVTTTISYCLIEFCLYMFA